MPVVIAGFVLFFVVLSFVFSIPVYLLWNSCLVGTVSGVNEITVMQAWGIVLLCSFLFKNTEVKKS